MEEWIELDENAAILPFYLLDADWRARMKAVTLRKETLFSGHLKV